MLPADLLLPRSMRGAKWFNGVDYISEEDRRKVIRAVETAKRCVEDPRNVGVRPAAYIGEPHPIASITHGPGGSRLYGCVHR